MRWTDEMQIETPEQIGLDLELAGLGSRFVAQLVDWCVKVVITFVLLIIAMILLGFSNPFEGGNPVLIATIITVTYLLWLGYAIYFEVRRNGQTPGKSFAAIRVVKQNGAALDGRAAFIRNLLAIADFLPAFHVVGALLILTTQNRQRLGDLAAGTVVIRERVAGEAPAGSDELLEDAVPEHRFNATQLARLTPNDRIVIRSYLQRFFTMNVKGRENLGLKLVDGYVEKLEYVLPREVDDAFEARAFLASLLRDMQEFARTK